MCLASAAAAGEGGERCRVAAPAEVRLDMGTKTEFFVGLVPADGYTVSTAGPLRISLASRPGKGLELRRSAMRRKHASDPTSTAPRFPIALEAQQPGEYQVEVTAHFWLCRASLCRPSRREISVPIVVPAPAADTPAGPEAKPEPSPKTSEDSK